ncbi:MAG: type II toxin-antitoxin system VapC family toxin [Candidatus Dormibacteria bacterium]
MTLVIDAAPLIALSDRADPRRDEVRRVLASEPGRLVIPATVTAEVDYILRQRAGRAAARAFLADLASASFLVESLTVEEHGMALEIDQRYPRLDVGLADLSIVVLAHRLGVKRLLTFDERHFRVLGPVSGGTFQLLPADG